MRGLISTPRGEPHPVGQKSPNAWGLYDMHGSVWEWCQDWFAVGYYAASPLDDPPGAAEGEKRVHRGGCWVRDKSTSRSSFRYWHEPSFRREVHGFRVARTVPWPAPSR